MFVSLSTRPLNDIVVVRKVSHNGRPRTEADRRDIEAQEFILRNPKWEPHNLFHIAKLWRFIDVNSVSVLALRGDDAVKFLDILEKVCASRTYRSVPMQGTQYFRRCRLRAVILWLQILKSVNSNRTFAGCHIGRRSILVPFSFATSYKSPMNPKSVPTVEYDHRHPWRAVSERCAARNGLNPTRQLWSQSRL